jgi:two-component system phosphate regulon sensor histidine kinase PhoR
VGVQPEQLDVLRKRVMAVVGHELRTPVTTLRGLAETLHAAGEHEIRDEIAPAMARLAARVESLRDDLLVAADLSTVLPVGRPRPASIEHAVRVAWSDLGHTGEPEVHGDVEAAAIVPPGSLPRMLSPLLDNAAKYGKSPVDVRIQRVPGEVTIEVESEGPPVSSIDVALAFEPFYRGEHAVTTAAGLGVGLPVCRTLVEQAGGTVAIESRDGGGIVATVRLPGQ